MPKRSWLMILLVLSAIAVPSVLQMRMPTQVMLQVNGSSVHVADTWQEWRVCYPDGSSEMLPPSSVGQILLSLEAASLSKRFAYLEVDIPIKLVQAVPSDFMLYVYSGYNLYFQDRSHPLPDVNWGLVIFNPGEPAGTTKFLKFWILSSSEYQAMLNDRKSLFTTIFGNYWISNDIVNLESYVNSLNISLLSLNNVELLGEAVESWIEMSGEGGFPHPITPTETVTVPFYLKVTMGTSSTTTMQTQTVGFTTVTVSGRSVIYVTVIVPSTSIRILPTTIYNKTFEGITTVFSGTTFTQTVSLTPTLPSLWDGFIAWFKSLLPASLQAYWWVILIIVVIVILWLLKKMFGGGSGVVVVR